VTPRVKQESAAKERGGIDILAVLSKEGKGNVMAGAACPKRRPPQLGGLKLQTVVATTLPAFRVDLAALASNLKSGAAFGATLYRVLVLSCATWCDVDIESKPFILRSLFSVVQGSARLCLGQSNRT
jgi:hypothetical protein